MFTQYFGVTLSHNDLSFSALSPRLPPPFVTRGAKSEGEKGMEWVNVAPNRAAMFASMNDSQTTNIFKTKKEIQFACEHHANSDFISVSASLHLDRPLWREKNGMG